MPKYAGFPTPNRFLSGRYKQQQRRTGLKQLKSSSPGQRGGDARWLPGDRAVQRFLTSTSLLGIFREEATLIKLCKSIIINDLILAATLVFEMPIRVYAEGRMKIQKRIGAVLISRMLPIAGLLIGFAACASADTTWTLNATFTGPHSAPDETVTGTFTTSGGSSTVAPTFISWDVSFTGPNTFVDSSTTKATTVIGENLNPWIGYGGGLTGYNNETELSFAVDPGFSPYVDIYLNAALTNGGTVNVIGGYDCPGCGTLQSGTLVSGTLIATTTTEAAVPEPSAMALLGANFGILGIVGIAIFRRHSQVRHDSLAIPSFSINS